MALKIPHPTPPAPVSHVVANSLFPQSLLCFAAPAEEHLEFLKISHGCIFLAFTPAGIREFHVTQILGHIRVVTFRPKLLVFGAMVLDF